MWCWTWGAVALAAEFRIEEEVVIGADEIVADDLYAVGRTVRIEGEVEGDVLALAERVVVDGVIGGDLQAAGRTIEIRGRIGDDARLAGQAVSLRHGAFVGDDLLAAGFGVEQAGRSVVEGSMALAAYQVILDGVCTGDLVAKAAAVRLAGDIEGDVDLELRFPEGAQPPPVELGAIDMPAIAVGLEVDRDARIGGSLRYASPEPGVVGGRIAGGSSHRVVDYVQGPEPPSVVFSALRRLMALLVVGLCAVAVFPAPTRAVAEDVWKRPVRALGFGLLALLVFWGAAVAVAVTTVLGAGVLGVLTLGGLAGAVLMVGALAEGFLATTFALVVGWVACVPVLYGAGTQIAARLGDRSWGRGWLLLLGLVPYVLITMIPLVGPLTTAIVTLLGLGALGERLARALRR